MKLHEYQAKDIFRKFNIPVPEGRLTTSPGEAPRAVEGLKGPPWVVKAQVHAGGRGKAGGVKVVHSVRELERAVETILTLPLVTKQTGPEGRMVHQVLIEEGLEIDRELYLAVVIDRSRARPVMIFSQAGGMDIEEVATTSPDQVLKAFVDPEIGWMPFQGRNLAYGIENPLNPEVLKRVTAVMESLYRLFISCDCSLAEINPLVITEAGKVVAADAKINIDDLSLIHI